MAISTQKRPENIWNYPLIDAYNRNTVSSISFHFIYFRALVARWITYDSPNYCNKVYGFRMIYLVILYSDNKKIHLLSITYPEFLWTYAILLSSVLHLNAGGETSKGFDLARLPEKKNLLNKTVQIHQSGNTSWVERWNNKVFNFCSFINRLAII